LQGGTITNGPQHEVSSFQPPNDTQLVSYTYMKDRQLIRVVSGGNTYDLAYDAFGRCVKRTLLTQTTMGPESSPRPTPTPRPSPTPAPRPSPPPPSPTPPPGFTAVTKYYIYDGERPILEYDGNGELAGYNLYGKGVDEILLRNDPTLTQEPRTFYYQQDHEGSVTHLTDENGNVIEKYRYDVFGAPTILDPDGVTVRTASIVSNRFLFTGREYNALFGFYEYRARAYHPGLGRFMSEDPKLFDAGDYNLFRYCHNDPIDFTDPMGLTDIDMSPELIGLIWQASTNSLSAYRQARDAVGRSQFVVSTAENKGRLSLQKNADGANRINTSKIKLELRKEYQQYRDGQKYRYVEQESGKVRQGEKLEGIGHIHADKTGHGTPQWSGTDINTASGTKTQLGAPVGRIDESNPVVMRVLVPQQEGGQPRERTFTASQIERMIEQGTEKAQEDSSNVIHSKPDPFPR